jgi:hypothetical protein
MSEVTSWTKNVPGKWWVSEPFDGKGTSLNDLNDMLNEAVNEGGMEGDSHWGTNVNKESEPWEVRLVVWNREGVVVRA